MYFNRSQLPWQGLKGIFLQISFLASLWYHFMGSRNDFQLPQNAKSTKKFVKKRWPFQPILFARAFLPSSLCISSTAADSSLTNLPTICTFDRCLGLWVSKDLAAYFSRILFRTLNHQPDYVFDWTIHKQKMEKSGKLASSRRWWLLTFFSRQNCLTVLPFLIAAKNDFLSFIFRAPWPLSLLYKPYVPKRHAQKCQKLISVPCFKMQFPVTLFTSSLFNQSF